MDKICEPPYTGHAQTDPLKAGTGAEGHAAGDKASEGQDLRFEIMRCALYHDMRSDWYAGLNRFVMMLNVVSGSAAVAAFGGQHPLLGQIGGVLVAVFSGASLVWDLNGQARTHSDLKRQFYGVLGDLEAGQPAAVLQRKISALYADEPSQMRAVNAIAHNNAGRSVFGEDFKAIGVSWMQRRTRHLVSWESGSFPDVVVAPD